QVDAVGRRLGERRPVRASVESGVDLEDVPDVADDDERRRLGERLRVALGLAARFLHLVLPRGSVALGEAAALAFVRALLALEHEAAGLVEIDSAGGSPPGAARCTLRSKTYWSAFASFTAALGCGTPIKSVSSVRKSCELLRSADCEPSQRALKASIAD